MYVLLWAWLWALRVHTATIYFNFIFLISEALCDSAGTWRQTIFSGDVHRCRRHGHGPWPSAAEEAESPRDRVKLESPSSRRQPDRCFPLLSSDDGLAPCANHSMKCLSGLDCCDWFNTTPDHPCSKKLDLFFIRAVL